MTTPDLTQRFLPYFIWFLIVILTNYFFSIFSKKTKSTGKILIAVFLPVWLIITVVTVIFDIIYLASYSVTPLLFSLKLIENIPQVFIFGGIAFFLKYRKFKKEPSVKGS
ncbi:hypothetical protein EOD40_08020 [Flavobacterium sufflavum]|uniref:Uncharacterized protein n=1 Tax=Flavobacterium sufflavum TaxID=1921138 RepID=A0A437KVM5_9FLAO|nr:hypothetical protein [Flavobacterium sufflavum]RVT76444.1 hypothetical protein EOD40_08020 [Flavobacterium sufflavum]